MGLDILAKKKKGVGNEKKEEPIEDAEEKKGGIGIKSARKSQEENRKNPSKEREFPGNCEGAEWWHPTRNRDSTINTLCEV